jgi:hypothetical protein
MIGGLDAPAALGSKAGATGGQASAAVPRVQAGPVDNTPWTVAVTDDQHDEMPIPRIVELFAAGTINAETYIWKQGMDDWQMPFDIPEIAAALRKRGLGPPASQQPNPARALRPGETEKMPTAPPPAGIVPSGVWREPGSWNDGVAWKEPALAPGQQHHDVSFDDVTVALAAPQAEALLRDAEFAAALDKDEPTAIFSGGPESPPLSSSRPVVAAPRPAAGRPVPRPEPKPDSDNMAIMGQPTLPVIAVATPNATPIVDDSAWGIPTPDPPRATPQERKQDLFGDAHRAGSEEHQAQEDSAAASQQRLIGERNESSVLFSLDKVVETEQEHAQKDRPRDEDLLGMATLPPPPEAAALPAMMTAAEEQAIDSALAAAPLNAPVAETTAPLPAPDPAPIPPPAVHVPAVSGVAPAEPDPMPKQEGGSGWLWALLLVLLLGVGAAIVIFYLRPAALFGPPAPAVEPPATALPIPTPPPTNLEPAVPAPSTATSVSSTATSAETSAPAASASASPPEPRPRERVVPRQPRGEGARAPTRKVPAEPSEAPVTEEQTAPIRLPPMDRDAGPRP